MVAFSLFFLFQWQQRVSYEIKADLNTEEHALRAVEYLTYYNNSPDVLETLYVHLYANAYRDLNTVYAQETKRLGRYGDYRFLTSKESERGYIDVAHVMHDDESLKFEIQETIMAIFLDEPLKSSDSLVLRFDFYLKIPKQISRLGYKDRHYEIVQWYPKICVFDEDGWHRDSYHALGEFYGEYGCFDVEISLPANYVVAATGERIDPQDKEFIDLLSTLASDECIYVTGDTKTVRFYAEDVHDFAWVCDPDFLVKQYKVDGIKIFVFYLRRNEKKWRNAGAYALDAVKRYGQWYGKYSYKNLSIVNGYFPEGGMEYPQLIIVSSGEDWLTRQFEEVIIHEIGHQWFYGILGSNELDEAWLDEGFTTYTAIRYFEDKYGRENSLLKLPFLPPLSNRYFNKLTYYVTQTNNLEKPILTSAYEYVDVPIAYMNSAYAKPALLLFNLEGILGRQRFDRILKKYVQEYKFRHPRTEDFVRICEEESGQNLKPLFSQFLNTTDFSDWAVARVNGHCVEIENRGRLLMPVDVFVEAESGAHVFRIDAEKKSQVIELPESAGAIKKVVIDPYGYSLEPNYWNNYYPRKIVIKPIFSFPSFDSYQILYLPYLWYGYHDGVTTGLYLFGARFVDFDYVKGRHQWTAGCIYGFKSKIFYPAFSYQTPILFKRGMRTRVLLRGSNSHGENKLGCSIMTNFGIPFSSRHRIQMTHSLSYYELRSFAFVDTIDWDFGRNMIFDNRFTYRYKTWNIHCGFTFSHKIIGSEFEYFKTFCEINKKIEAFIPVTVRAFAGRIIGNAPNQEKFFLSGALRISIFADLLFGQAGYFSPQEHLHIQGDGNMLGYKTLHIKSDEMYCINLELPSEFPIRLFADYGYYGEHAVDFGAKVVLGPISFNFPFYTRTDEPWSLRWSMGVGN